MKKISIILLSLLFVLTACDYEQEQIYDNLKETPTAPALTIEGVKSIALKPEMPSMFYSALSWSKANYGKGVSVDYTMEVCDNEDFGSGTVSVAVGKDVLLKTLTLDQLLDWAASYGAYNKETDELTPITLYFRIMGQASSDNPAGVSTLPAYSNAEGISLSEYEEPIGPWHEELTIKFLPTSVDWEEYAVYAWGDEEVYGVWPGEVLEADEDGWYTFIVPVNRPINLIFNNNNNGRQFNFLTDPEASACYEFAIDEDNNCEWTEVDCPSSDPAMFMIGEEFGNWEWNSSGVVKMAPVNGYEGHFWAVRYITAGTGGFKWSPERGWGNDFNSLGDDRGFTTADGNAHVAESGMYMVYVDTENNIISVEPAKVFGMGNCFGGWDTGAFPFAVEGKTMTNTTIATDELRIYAMSDIAPVGDDWWRMEFVPIDGVIEYRGNGPDQTRVKVDAGTKVVLDFNAGTGTFE
jgi:hypothetical protein